MAHRVRGLLQRSESAGRRSPFGRAAAGGSVGVPYWNRSVRISVWGGVKYVYSAFIWRLCGGTGLQPGWKGPCDLERVADSGVMKRSEIVELHYICPIATVPSILCRGILSHRAASRVFHDSIASEEVQSRRAVVRIPGGRKLHDYVNLYFNGRNPMMFTVCKSRGVDAVCLLRVAPEVLERPGVVVTDCNASSRWVRFSEPLNGLERIDSAETFARYWNHRDTIKKLRHKSRMCAEVLVPSIIPPDAVMGAYAGSSNAENELRIVAPSLRVTLDRDKFFN